LVDADDRGSAEISEISLSRIETGHRVRRRWVTLTWTKTRLPCDIPALTALLIAGAACAACGVTHSEHPPTLVCGQNLAGGVVVPYIIDVTSTKGSVTLRTPRGTFFRLTDNCTNGVSLSFQPPGSGNVVRQASARDGKPVAVEVHSHLPEFTMELVRPDGEHDTVHVMTRG
jgi:hypothetical protein